MSDIKLELGDGFRNRFNILDTLGQGGMGAVYLAYDAFSQRQVAIKLVKTQSFETPEIGARTKKMWFNETRLAGKLRHPYVMEIYEAGVADEHAYLVMEYLKGYTLKKYCLPGALLPVATVIEILYKVCNALEYANTVGLLHRDIKPANIILTGGSNIKITDFGAAYFTKSEETQVLDVGTLPFMPPEHFSSKLPTIQSDIYAVGVTAYQLLTGFLPFNADSMEQMIQQKLSDQFVPMETRRKDLSPELRFIIHRAISNQQVRYASWKEFCDQLSHALPEVSRPKEVLYETSRFEALRRWPFFREFGDPQLWETIHLSVWHELPGGQVIFDEGTSGDSVYVIAQGEVAFVRSGIKLDQSGAGECFGEIAFLQEEQPVRSATAIAITEVLLMEIPAEGLRNASDSLQAVFDRAFIRLMISRIKSADRRFLDLVKGGA